MSSPEDLAEIQQVCAGAIYKTEGGQKFVFLPALIVRTGDNTFTRDALLTLRAHSSYASRLFLSEQIPGRGGTYQTHTVLGRTWCTPSWKNVRRGRPIEMLMQHLKAYA